MKRIPRCLFRIDIGGIKEFHVGLGGGELLLGKL